MVDPQARHSKFKENKQTKETKPKSKHVIFIIMCYYEEYEL